jgi:hypothetical protein
LEAVTVGTSIAAFGPSGRGEVADADAGAEVAVFSGSGMLLLGATGCDFHNHSALLDFTDTEKAIAVTTAITEINNVAVLFLLKLRLRKLRVLRRKPGRFLSRGIGNSFWLSLTNSFLGFEIDRTTSVETAKGHRIFGIEGHSNPLALKELENGHISYPWV